MDAFSVSCCNGLAEPGMKRRRMAGIAGVYAWFQFMMPLIGWLCVHTVAETFTAFQSFIPWIALLLLLWLGGNMLRDGLRGGESEEIRSLSFSALLMQGVATSIDALSVGFTIAEYDGKTALIACLIIASVTFVICVGGLLIGRRVGNRLAGKASILGGAILILIGLEIFFKGI